MSTKDKVARRKLSTLELASELHNVSKACRILGYSPPGRVWIGGDLRFRRRIARSRSYRPRGRFAKAGDRGAVLETPGWGVIRSYGIALRSIWPDVTP